MYHNVKSKISNISIKLNLWSKCQLDSQNTEQLEISNSKKYHKLNGHTTSGVKLNQKTHQEENITNTSVESKDISSKSNHTFVY